MQVNATAIGTFAKSAAFGPYVRVVLSGGVLALAGALDAEIGTTKQRVLATGLGAGTVADVVLPNAEGTIRMIASGAVTQFARVYGAAAGKVSATANGNLIGIALTSTASDGDELEVLRLADASGNLYAAVAASAAHVNTTDEAIFDKSFSIPPDVLKAGDVLRIWAQGIATATNAADTLTVNLRIGGLAGTIIAATGAVDVANNDIFYFSALVVIRTAGAGGTLVATGVQALGVVATVTAKPFLLGSTAINTTAAQVVCVSADWSAANAGNSCRLDVLHVERLAA